MSWRATLRQRLVSAAVGLPPEWTFAAFDALSRTVAVRRLPVARTAAEALGLDAAARDRFCRRAWTGTKASEVIWQALERRPDAAATLVADIDFSALERAAEAGRGLIVAAAHIGPQRVLATLLRDRYPETLFLLHERGLVPGPVNARTIEDESNRGAALVAANRHLRSGGVVFVAPDGISGPLSLTLPFSGGSVRMSRGAATLARLSGAASVPLAVVWVERVLRMISGPPIAVSADAGDAWEREWLVRYLAQLERWTRELPPENLRLHGSIYERWERVRSR